MTAADGEACAVVATAADIICSLRGADLAGWTPPWRKPLVPPACDGARDEDARGGGLAWPAVARGKRTRSSRSGSADADADASAATKKKKNNNKKPRRGARGSPASPLDYSGGSGSGSGSGASTSGGEDGAFCSSQPAAAPPPPAAVFQPATAAAPAAPSKVGGGLAGRRAILPVPPPRPAGAGPGQQRARKKMRLPEIQQMVRSLSAENDALREEMKALQRACAGLSKENSKLETRLGHSSKLSGVISVETKGKRPKPDEHQHAGEHGDSQNGFVLPDLNLPADA